MRFGKGGLVCDARIRGKRNQINATLDVWKVSLNLTADQYFFWTITENVLRKILNNFIRNFLTLGLFIVNPANYCLLFPSIYNEIDHDEINVVRGRCSF